MLGGNALADEIPSHRIPITHFNYLRNNPEFRVVIALGNSVSVINFANDRNPLILKSELVKQNVRAARNTVRG